MNVKTEEENKIKLAKARIKDLNIVEIKELKTDIGITHLLRIAGIDVRIYLDKGEAERIAGFMYKVVLAIILKAWNSGG